MGLGMRLENQMFVRRSSSAASRISYIASILSATVLLTLYVPSAVHAQNAFNGPGTYEIVKATSGQVLDVNQNGQRGIYLARSASTDSQKWEVSRADSGYYFLRNVSTDM